MKLVRRFSTAWAYVFALVAAALITAEAAPIKNKAVVRRAVGKAEISNDGGKTWNAARVGTRLGENAVVRTAPGAQVDLFLGDNGPVVRVTEDTRMGIDKLDLEDAGIEKVIETQLDLRNGRILGNVKKMAAASKYEVTTPVGVAGIRGTEYSISANGDVSVVTGTVVVVYVVDGRTYPAVIVGAGQTVRAPVAGAVPIVAPATPAILEALRRDLNDLGTGGPGEPLPRPEVIQTPAPENPVPPRPEFEDLTRDVPHSPGTGNNNT